MNKLTGKEIIDKLSNTHLTVSDFAYGLRRFLPEDALKYSNFSKGKDWDNPECKLMSAENKIKVDQFFKDLVGEWEEVSQHGGEGEGDNWYSVKYFKDHDVYLKVNGYYQSHYGTDFGSWKDAVKTVVPKEKVITIYE